MLLSMVPGLLVSKAFAYNCSNVAQYQEPNSYQNGTVVKNGGSAYQCTVGGWCNIGGPYAPGTGWAWTNAWSLLGSCDGTTTSSTPSSVVASSRSSVASSVITTTSSATSATNCSGLATWNATSVYTQGMQVSLNGVKYEAKWWTQNQNPTTNSSADGVWKVIGNCGAVSSVASSVVSSRAASSVASSVVSSAARSSTASSVVSGGKKVVGYFAQWGVYARNFHVKNIATSGSASKLTHILYAFGNVQNGQCVIGDSYADYERAYTADLSVDGVADTWDQPLRGSFNQLRKLKKANPNLKVIWSFGGWTWSGGFGQAAANPTAFANSCYNLVEDARWADVFDGIDIDWEYPND
jgi:chitinase